MDIRLSPVLHIHETGKRRNNEDSWIVSDDGKLLMVCDGVGGADRGEIASQTVCRRIDHFFKNHPNSFSDDRFIEEAIQDAIRGLQEFVAQNPDAENMATTLTLLHVHEKGITAAHMGDSRIYQIRDGRIVFKTQDHSLVNDLVRAGLISEADAASHPQKNVITRAIQANAEKSGRPEVQLLTDVQPGDKFILCSDGILESFDDPALVQALEHSTTAAERTLRHQCQQYSNDNFTAILFEIAAVNGQIAALPKTPVAKAKASLRATIPQNRAPIAEAPAAVTPAANGRFRLRLIGAAAAVFCAALAFFLLKDQKKPSLNTIEAPPAEQIIESKPEPVSDQTDSRRPSPSHTPLKTETLEKNATESPDLNTKPIESVMPKLKPSPAENIPRSIGGSRAENSTDKPKGSLSDDLQGTTKASPQAPKQQEKDKDDLKEKDDNRRWFGNNGL